MGSKVGDDDTRTVLTGGRIAKPSKRRLAPPSDSGAHPKSTRNNTLVGEAKRNGSSDIVNEILGCTDAGKHHHDLDQNMSGSEGAEEEVVCLDSLGITEEEDFTEDDLCVKCGKGGDLLVCSGCPISVHKNCMNCPALYDRSGNFYCPVCSCRKAEKKAALARTYLSQFMAKGTVDGGLQERSPKRVRLEKPSPSTPKDGLECDGLEDLSIQIKKDQVEERYKNFFTTSISPHVGVDASVLAARTDDARLDDGPQIKTESVQRIHEETLVGAEDGLDYDEIVYQNVQIKKDQQEESDKDCCTMSASPHIGAETSEIAVRTDNVSCRYGDRARTDDDHEHGAETVQQIHEATLVGAEDGLDRDGMRNQNVQIEKGCQEESDKNCCTRSASPHIGSEIAAKTDNVLCRSADHARPDDIDQFRRETVQQIHEETFIARGRADQGAYREEAGHSCRDLPNGQTALEEHQTVVVYDHQNESMFQREQQIGQSSFDGVHKAAGLDDELQVVSDSETENRKTMKEGGEGVQGMEDGSTRLSKGGDSMQQDQGRSTPILDCPKTTNLISEETKNALKKSGGYVGVGTTCKTRRRKLAWTPEEENKLKEGVEKFSGTVKKNVPWRKILEFGRGVFECSRNPDDLKDKWRTMTRKRSSVIECDLTDHLEPAN